MSAECLGAELKALDDRHAGKNAMSQKSATTVLFGVLLMAFGASCAAAKQLAIVVGNDAYTEVTPLNAGVNDAMAMAEGLKRAGIAVELVVNATKRQISRALANVEGNIAPGDTVVFHFSGHGFEIDGQNWLLPIDVPAAREGEAGLVKDESFNAADADFSGRERESQELARWPTCAESLDLR